MLHKSVESERGTVHYWISRSNKDRKTLVKAAHFSNGDNPRQVNAEILRFIQQL